ncbi:MAG: acetyl-CoA carboxylase biotin carboxyl carrier protein [Kiritimatiellae bacterium]|nr:acetyl-CoA carboxylase biotin carboxyl carrier protein [Kiritimatiellia bacterium]MDD5520480.1 acetyl-CoA carboxylase biotin carboxyl carrier protein [Kiritimatiellia bacterium]
MIKKTTPFRHGDPSYQKWERNRIPLRITDTTLRDAHQSLWATRMRTSDILQIIDTIDSAGYYSLEVWGGATFDVCLRFLRENPWERLRLIKKGAKKTPLQMLLRGQNILGYRNYPDDVLDRFVALACENGIDIFRIFDALNDTRNLEYAIKCVKQHGGHAQGTICYTISPVHTVKQYVKVAREQVQMGIDSLCIKDMAGILSPISAEKLISALTSEIKVPIQLHCHATSGMASSTYVEGVRAGAGAIDCAISIMAGFSSQPPVETMLAIFEETPYHANLDIEALRKICKYFTELAPSRRLSHHPDNIIDPEILIHHIPGGMISNLRNQLQQQNALDKLDEVLTELPRVCADMGYPPLVTPTSQIVGVQAVMNVIAGERYAMIPQETKDYVRGLYGRSPAPMDFEIKRKILGMDRTITCRPADLMEPMLPKATKDIDPKLINNEEDIISYCLFPEQALEYFKWRLLPPDQRPPSPADVEREKEKAGQAEIETGSPHPQKQFMSSPDYKELHALIDKVNELHINEIIIKRDDVSLSLKSSKPGTKIQSAVQTRQSSQTGSVSATSQSAAQETTKQTSSSGNPTINAPLHGTFYSSSSPGKPPFVKEGDMVKAGDPVCIVEAMKLFNQINAPSNCQIVRVLVEHAKPVQKGQPLIEIKLN